MRKLVKEKKNSTFFFLIIHNVSAYIDDNKGKNPEGHQHGIIPSKGCLNTVSEHQCVYWVTTIMNNKEGRKKINIFGIEQFLRDIHY